MYFQFNGVTGEAFEKLIDNDLEAFKEVVKLYE